MKVARAFDTEHVSFKPTQITINVLFYTEHKKLLSSFSYTYYYESTQMKNSIPIYINV